MFGSLRKYRQDYSFYDESPFIELSSNYKDYQYVIFGLMITSGNWYSDFCYWNMEELDTEDDFNSYVNTVKNSSLIDTGVDVSYGDKLLTLSTCYADEDNSRFIVVARRLRDDEVENDFTSIKKTAENEAEQKDKESADEN
jgi:sortase B